MLIWNRQLWLIDHGAALYFHHGPQDWNEQAKKPFTLIKDHVLLRQASQLGEAEAKAKAKLTPDKINELVSLIPDAWLIEGISFDDQRARYEQYFKIRLENAAVFINEANHAREALI